APTGTSRGHSRASPNLRLASIATSALHGATLASSSQFLAPTGSSPGLSRIFPNRRRGSIGTSVDRGPAARAQRVLIIARFRRRRREAIFPAAAGAVAMAGRITTGTAANSFFPTPPVEPKRLILLS